MNYSLQVREFDVPAVVRIMQRLHIDFEVRYFYAPIANSRDYLVSICFSDEQGWNFTPEIKVELFTDINSRASYSVTVLLMNLLNDARSLNSPLTYYLDGSQEKLDRLTNFLKQFYKANNS